MQSLDFLFFFFFNDTATTEIYTLSLHDALPIYLPHRRRRDHQRRRRHARPAGDVKFLETIGRGCRPRRDAARRTTMKRVRTECGPLEAIRRRDPERSHHDDRSL